VSKNQKYQVCIIGGGPAGSTCAFMAKKLGISFIVIERKEFPKDKVCGDGITFGCLEILRAEGFDLTEIEKDGNLNYTKNIRFHNSKGENISINNNLFCTLERERLDSYLWNQIENKNKLERTTILDISRKQNVYEITITRDSGQQILEADFIIGADGYSSFIRRRFFPKLVYPKRISCRYYATSEILTTDTNEFYFIDGVKPGYFWIFPLSGKKFNTGVYLPNGTQEELFAIHRRFIEAKMGFLPDENDFKSWVIPNNIELDKLAINNVLLTGDAAGLCDPLFGHGIDNAIMSGIAAINSINYFISSNHKNFPIDEVYRYHLSVYFKDILYHSNEIMNKIEAGHLDILEYIKSVISK